MAIKRIYLIIYIKYFYWIKQNMSSVAYTLITDAIVKGDLSKRITSDYAVNETLNQLALQINPKGDDILTTLMEVTPEEKKAIYQHLKKYQPRLTKPQYRPVFHEFSNYNRSNHEANIINTYLDNTKRTKFCINIDVEKCSSIFIEDQYLHLEFSQPEIDPKFDTSTIENYDPSRIRFRYTKKPGIRVLPEYTFVCEGADIQTVNREQVHYKDLELVEDHLRHLWNILIGEDNGTDFEAVLPSTNALWVPKIKVGYQTPKDVQERLVLNVPVLFNYNEEKVNRLNTSSFRNRSIAIHGLIERSDLIVRAEYYGPDFTGEPIVIPCLPLKVEDLRIISNYIEVGDEMHALNLCGQFNRLIDLPDTERILLKDLDECVKIKGNGLAEAISVYVRPKSYESDFDLWTETQEIEKRCVQMPILIEGPGGDVDQAAVQAAKANIPVDCIKDIGLLWRGDEIKCIAPGYTYDLLVKYKLATTTQLYNVNKLNGIYLFLFNDLWNTRQISSLYNMDGLNKPELRIKFTDDKINKQNELCQEYCVYVIRHMINQITSFGRTVGIRRQQ